MNLELKKAIDQISKDKGLDRDMLIKTLEDAVRTSVQRRFSEDMDVEVRYNDNTGDIEVYQFKIVVEDGEVENEDTHIGITEARTHDPSVQIDDEVGFRVKVEDLGRIAAQSAKQVIIQRMRDAEQEIIYDEYKDRMGEIVSGIVQRRDKGGWVVNLGRTEAILPREEQIPREHYKRNDRVQAIIIDVRKEGRGPQVVVSRAHRDYMAALFRREVPEVDDGVVQIMGVARDPGSRAKVAVLSRERDVDPVGACVGVRGSRIQNIVQELRGERIDGRRRAREVGRARNARPYGTGTKKEGSFAFRFDIRLFIALRHDAAKLEHQPLGRGRAAVGDCGDALAERFRTAARALGKILPDHAAVEQGGQRNVEDGSNLRQHLQRNRAFAPLQTAEMKLGNFQAVGGFLLRDVKRGARGADVAADGLERNEHVEFLPGRLMI